MRRFSRLAGSTLAVALGLAAPALAQLNENCTVSILNRTAQVKPDGSWRIDNIPAGAGPVRARATCVQNGITTFGQSNLFVIAANQVTGFNANIVLGSVSPIPNSIVVTAPTTSLTTVGATTQLTVTGTYANAVQADLTTAASATTYNVSNPAIATISPNGLVTAVATGTAIIQAVNEGAQGLITIQIKLAGADSDHDGIPDDAEIRLGLNPRDKGDASLDPDHDGLTNLQEYQLGTDINKADTDGDGLTDGQEVLIYHTNPLVADSDGDGVPDGLEITLGTNPLSAASVDLGKAITSIDITPKSFVISVNALNPNASQQLTVTARLADGYSKLDLTPTTRGTTYASSDLTVCNFGAPDGNIFAGNAGNCTITIKTQGKTFIVNGVVSNFTPAALSFVTIPGFANSVDVNGNYAYVAAGSSGLQVVDVTNRAAPSVVKAFALAGNANDVKLNNTLAFVAAGSTGLHAVDVTNPLTPVLKSTLNTGGTALNLAIRGNTAYIANSTNLVIANVSNPAAMTISSTLAIPGTVRGIDVDTSRKLAVVASGANIYVVDIANLAAPVLKGSVATGDARDVVISGNYVYVADYLNSTTSVDITDPAAPVKKSNVTDANLGGFLQDIVLSDNLALAADVKFVNGIPITDITTPTALVARSILNFPARDDNGMGLAVDGSYVYLVAEHGNLNKYGSFGDSRLYIAQFRPVIDNNGVPPTVSISSPANGATVTQGADLNVTATAADDVAVVSVNFLVEGVQTFTDSAPPYQFTTTVPTGVASLTLGATASDLGGNIGTAANVVLKVIPDPLTTVQGRVVDKANTPVAGATVTVFTATATSAADGTFQISGVPTVKGQIIASAVVTVAGKQLKGKSAATAPVGAAITAVGDIVVKSASAVGYYDISSGQGVANQLGPITKAGLTGTSITDLTNVDLSAFDILFVQNPSNGDFAAGYTNNKTKVNTFVQNGGILILHDRFVTGAAAVLPGSPGTFFRDFGDAANIDIVDNTTLVTNGPGGVITNTSLDGGNSSSHGYITLASLPAGSKPILSRSDATRIVTYSYPFGTGFVIYSTIPLDFYLGGTSGIGLNMTNYAANVIAYAANLR